MLQNEFDLWWPLYKIADEKEMIKKLNHPLEGEFSFEHTSYIVSNDTDLKMFVDTPLSGTDTKEKMKKLILLQENEKQI